MPFDVFSNQRIVTFFTGPRIWEMAMLRHLGEQWCHNLIVPSPSGQLEVQILETWSGIGQR